MAFSQPTPSRTNCNSNQSSSAQQSFGNPATAGHGQKCSGTGATAVGSGTVRPSPHLDVYPIVPPAEQALIDKYLASTSATSTRFMDCKHYYGSVNFGPADFSVSGTELAFALNGIQQGPLLNNRLTNKIRMLSVHIKLIWSLEPIGFISNTANNPTYPRLSMYIVRDKVPAIAGTSPTMVGTGSNPPANPYVPFTRMGATQTIVADRTALPNPIAWPRFHFYEIDHQVPDTWYEGATSIVRNSAANTFCVSKQKVFEYKIDLHRCTTTFAASGSGAASLNQVWMILRNDYCSTAIDASNGFAMAGKMNWDLSFEDIQDGE